MTTILILEDEESIRSFLRVNLKRHNFKVLEATNGEEALAIIDQDKDIALVLLDVMLPGIDGFEVCRILRTKYPALGIIMLTAKGQEADKLEGLGGGADDYIVKPFSPAELLARINTLLRRISLLSPEKSAVNSLVTGPFRLSILEKKLYKNNKEVNLTPTEFSIMELFLTNEQVALSRDMILDKVWGDNYSGDIKVVDVNVRRIRRKIEDDPVNPRYIESVWGYGYRFQGEIKAE